MAWLVLLPSLLAKPLLTVGAVLRASDFQHPISHKEIFNGPQTKDFKNMFEFLAIHFDPNRRPRATLQEEVVGTMRQLGYPLSVSKASLQAVGTPHTWPNLLAVLTWMVELLEYDKAVSQNMEEEFGSLDVEKFLFAILARSYKNFMSDNYDELAQDEEMEEYFEIRNSSCTEESQELQEENDALRAEAEELAAEVEAIKAKDAKRDEMRRDKASFIELIEGLEKHKVVVERQLQKQQIELEQVQAERQRAEAAKREYREKVGMQEMSVCDVQRLQQDKVTMDENLQRIKDEKEEIDKELWDTQVAVKEATDELEDTVKAYQKKAEQLKIVPASAKLAEGRDMSLKFNRLASNVDDMVDKDLKHIKRHLGDVKMKLVAKSHAVEDDRFEATEELHQVKSAITEHSDAITQVSEALDSAERTLEREKELWTEKKRAVAKEVEEIKSASHVLKTADESTLAVSQRKLQDIHAEYQATKQRFESEKEMVNEALFSLTMELTDHRDYIQRNLKVMADKAEAVLQEVKDEDGEEDTSQVYAE